jgi:hypothetical protein
VAASRDLIRAVEEAQYADGDGPCVQALRDEAPVAAPAIATVMRWPGFTREALRLGLRASVSVPLFVASGRAAAVLNLHGRDDAAMAPLIAGVWSIYDPDRELPAGDRLLPLDAGGRELLAGFAAAVAVRSVIQRALTVLADTEGRTVPDACRELFRRAVARGVSVRAAADGVLAGRS